MLPLPEVAGAAPGEKLIDTHPARKTMENKAQSVIESIFFICLFSFHRDSMSVKIVLKQISEAQERINPFL